MLWRLLALFITPSLSFEVSEAAEQERAGIPEIALVARSYFVHADKIRM